MFTEIWKTSNVFFFADIKTYNYKKYIMKHKEEQTVLSAPVTNKNLLGLGSVSQ